MKRLLRLTGRLLRRIRAIRIRRILSIPLVILAIGLGAGFWIGRVSAPTPTNVKQQASQRPPSTHNLNDPARIDSGYQYAKDRIAADQKVKRLTDQQAKDVRTKLDELYKLRKELLGISASDAAAKREQKRQEIRSWAKEHQLSTRYFTRLY